MTGVEVEGSTADVARVIGVTYRRLYYWVRRGYLDVSDPTPGSGHPLVWTTDEIARAQAFARIVDELGVQPSQVSLDEISDLP
jgi:hypothetical protein